MIPAAIARQAQQSAKHQLEALRDALKAADAASSADRADLDNLARGRNYRGVAAKAEQIASRAKVAQAQAEELDRLMTEAAKRP